MGGTTSRLAAPHEVPLATKEIERDVEAGQQYADDVVQVEQAARVAYDPG